MVLAKRRIIALVIFKKAHNPLPTLLAVLAALLYSSWPLGYWLDPVVERSSMASELQAAHHPYNWFFIATDVLAGLFVILVGAWQWSRVQKVSQRLAISNYVLFGALVIVAAASPLPCNPATHQCGPLIDNYRVLLHGIASIASVTFLFVSLVALTPSAFSKNRHYGLRVVFTLLLLAWTVFAVGSVYELVHHIQGNAMQYFFITICSLSVIAVITTIERRRLRVD